MYPRTAKFSLYSFAKISVGVRRRKGEKNHKKGDNIMPDARCILVSCRPFTFHCAYLEMPEYDIDWLCRDLPNSFWWHDGKVCDLGLLDSCKLSCSGALLLLLLCVVYDT